MPSYQGHRSKAAWNVCLYINNEEPLYRRGVELMRKLHSAKAAARVLMKELPEKTPDGFRYTHRSVAECLAGILG